MAFSSNSGGSGLMADINVTPLVDVMLVLLIAMSGPHHFSKPIFSTCWLLASAMTFASWL